ncbi:dipeptide ABC transporter ATP-binding protein [Clostridium sp. OM02-18AC]|uniref:ABC transporter ATP-binding protein n=1 Tax=Clostridium sp. OM02-18AC TaxID=2292311 RepID=UPI000E47BC49|nr:dipeptide ABC transporter ATP-binding protein [Clostridium sp. OM02-18AC]RHV69039.1 dipeptide ABC transporter ATP-binding protein [Clostridium sp. OM02-18AC]
MGTTLEVIGLKKYFNVANGGLLHAVDDVSFKIERGETLGIVGESGCGKSTLGRTILRLHEPTAGKVICDGMDICSFDKEEMRQMRKEMQIIFQDPYASLNPRFTISQIIEEPLKLHNIYKTAAERREKVEELMALTGLSKRMYNMYPHEFDGGRRQRVVIARALSLNPKFIICDEPVSALDVSVQAQIINLMMELQEKLGLTYVFISHDMSVIKHISTNIGVMYLGQMIEKASKNEIFKHPLHPYTIALLSAIPSVNIREKKEKIILKGEIGSPVNPKPGCRFAPRCPFATEQCRKENPVFREVQPDHFVACHRVDEMLAGKLQFPGRS